MGRKQEDAETVRGDAEYLTEDPQVLQAISILEEVVEEKIGTASDGRL